MLAITRRLKWVSFSLLGGMSVLLACSDDPIGTPAPDPSGVPEAGTTPPVPDSSTDPPQADAGADANESDADSDEVTATMGSTGTVTIYDFAAIGEFYEDNLVVRSTLAPDCVMHIRSVTKPPSAAGTMTVSSDLVGEEGGPSAPLVVEPDEHNAYAGFLDDDDLFFPASGGTKVQLDLTGSVSMPPIPVTTLHAPLFETVTVTNPLTPDDGTLHVPTNKDLTIAWTVADAGTTPQRVSLAAYMVQSVNREGQLRCSWPLAQGTATVPAAVLAEFRTRLGGTGAALGRIEVFAGESKEITEDGASYVVVVTRMDSTDFIASDLSLE